MARSAAEVPTDRHVDLVLEGLHCAACVGRVERALGAVPGVERATVNLASGRARVTLSAALGEGALEEAVAQAGYRAERPARVGGSGGSDRKPGPRRPPGSAGPGPVGRPDAALGAAHGRCPGRPGPGASRALAVAPGIRGPGARGRAFPPGGLAGSQGRRRQHGQPGRPRHRRRFRAQRPAGSGLRGRRRGGALLRDFGQRTHLGAAGPGHRGPGQARHGGRRARADGAAAGPGAPGDRRPNRDHRRGRGAPRGSAGRPAGRGLSGRWPRGGRHEPSRRVAPDRGAAAGGERSGGSGLRRRDQWRWAFARPRDPDGRRVGGQPDRFGKSKRPRPRNRRSSVRSIG